MNADGPISRQPTTNKMFRFLKSATVYKKIKVEKVIEVNLATSYINYMHGSVNRFALFK